MSDIKPLAAECRIGYGDKKVAVKGDLFTPSNEADRADLLALGAARELTDVEQELHEQLNAPAKPLTAAEKKAAEKAAAEAAEAEAAAAETAAAAAGDGGTGTEGLLG